MEDTAFIYKLPEKRRIWVSVILCLFGSGLPMIYCGRLWQGIIVEITLIVVYYLLFVLLFLLPELYVVLILAFIAFSLLIGFLVYNIMLTIETNRRKIRWLKRTWGLIILVWVLSWSADAGLSILRRGYLIEAYKIPSAAMENALLVADFLMVTKNINPEKIQNGDLIVFKYPGDPRMNYKGKGTNYIKRVIAIGGQTIEIKNKQVFVDCEPFDEPRTVKIDSVRILPHYNDRYQWGPGNRDNMPEIVVPEGKLFVMGDNRDNSSDSRFWGFVDVKDVVGRARFIYFSWDSEKSHVRLERIGLRLDD